MFKRTLSLAISAVILAGCNTAVTKPQQGAESSSQGAVQLSGVELKNAAASELKKMFASGQAIDRGLDEYEVIYRAVMHNLDSRLRRLESTFTNDMLVVDNLAVLPSLANNAGYSTSQVFGNTDQTSAYKVSSSFDGNSSNLAATWNVLDMALGYYNSKLNGDNDSAKSERERRAGMDIVRHAKEAYWRAYAAQQLSSRVDENLKLAKAAVDQVQQSVRSGKVDALEALQQRKSLLETTRQLESLKQELDFASLNLSQVVNARPGEELKLKDSPMGSLDVSASLAALEKRAYSQSPDIREFKTRESFTIAEAKKVSAFLFPSLPAAASLQTSGDSQPAGEWAQYGLNVGWNLIKLANDSISDKTEIETEEARALAVRIAVLAKTHIAFEAYRSSQQRFDQAQELYEIEALIAQQNSSRKSGAVSDKVETILSETSAINAELRRYDAYARLVSAYETLQGTVGDDSELVAVIDERNKRLSEVQNTIAQAEADIEKAEAAIQKADAESLALRQELTQLSMSLNQTVAELVTTRSQAADAEQALELATQREKASTEAISKLDTLIATQNVEVSDSRREVAQAQLAVQAEAEAVQNAESKLTSLNSDRQSAVQQLLALNERESQLFAARLSENQEVNLDEIRQVTSDREKITSRMEKLNGEIQTAQKAVLDAQANKLKAERDLSAVQTTEAGFAARLQVLTSQRTMEQQKFDLATQQLSAAKAEEARLKDSAAVAEARVEAIKVRQEEIRSSVEALTGSREKRIAEKEQAEKTYFDAQENLGFLEGAKK